MHLSPGNGMLLDEGIMAHPGGIVANEILAGVGALV
jgi:hypothetical protein